MASDSTKVWCSKCRTDTWVKHNGNCPGCDRLITVLPHRHMEPQTEENHADR